MPVTPGTLPAPALGGRRLSDANLAAVVKAAYILEAVRR